MCYSALAGLILGLHPANERRRYKVTPSHIGWTQTKNQACINERHTCQYCINYTHEWQIASSA